MSYDSEEIFSNFDDFLKKLEEKEYISRTFENGLRPGLICGVYKISNSVNEKIYIGSSKDIQTRWKSGHCRELMLGVHHSTSLQNFFNKKSYQYINFKIECLEECPEAQLIQREQYYLNTLLPFRDNGYNICTVASSSKGLKRDPEMIANLSKKIGSPLNQYSLEGVFIKTHESPYIAFQNTGLNNRAIANAAFRRKNGSFGGFIWRPSNSEFLAQNLTQEQLEKLKRKTKHIKRPISEIKNRSKNFGRKVAKYDLDGNLIKVYDSMYLAAIENGLKKENIRACCRGKQKSGIHANFKWQWASEKSKFFSKKVGRFSSNWELLEVFSSAKEAQNTGLYRAVTISDACRGKIKSYRGFNWKYLE